MEQNNPILIAVDPGHGGYDNGAQWEGRLEKDDNLRLGLAVRDALKNQGVDVLMTRDTDVFIPLSERAAIANQNDADLFVSLHRNSYTEPTATSYGVENYIYLTAPEATTGVAAQNVLDSVVEAGVQGNRGVSRGNYYVLRRTNMPAMLLEMGFILNDEDNRLFDENLDAYAEAIAKGVMEYFGLTYVPPSASAPSSPSPAPAPAVPAPAPAASSVARPTPTINVPSRVAVPAPSNLTALAQQTLNSSFGARIPVSGRLDAETKRALVRALQTELNNTYRAGLAVDGIYGPRTAAAIQVLRPGNSGSLVQLLQIALGLRGYDTGGFSGGFDSGLTRSAVQMFQRDNYLVPDGVVGESTWARLLR
jgi:peptidoglycan hydrolase-like protein with peptidoglycan-binding domain